MAAIVGREVDAASLMIRRDDNTDHVKHRMFPQILFVDTDHVGGRSDVGLGVVIEREAINITEVAGLTDSNDDTLCPPVKAAKHLAWRDFGPIPCSYCALDGLEQSVLANTLRAAQHQSMIDLLPGPL